MGRWVGRMIGLVAVSAVVIGLGGAGAGARPQGQTYVLIAENLAEGYLSKAYRHPGHFRLYSEDSTLRFRHLHWRHWGGRRSVAHGRVTVCSTGSVSGSTCHRGRVKLVASHWRRVCPPSAYYEKLVAFGVPDYGRRLDIPLGPVECGPTAQPGETL